MKNIKLFIVEFLILFVLISICFFTKNNNDDMNILEKNISDWQSKYIAYDEGWHVNDENIKTSREVDAIYGPYAFLKRGYYTLKISYDCECDQAFKIFANNGNAEYIKSDKGILDAKKKYVSYKFNLTNDIDNFEVQIKYNGVGNLNVYNISVHKDNTFYNLLLLIFIVVLLFSKIYKYIKINENKGVVLSLLIITYLASMPLMVRGINYGHDLGVHLMRIEGISKEISIGNIPVRNSSLWISGYGYPISIYYGDVLLYVPAILRLFGVSVITSYKIYIFTINLLTAFICYYSFNRIFKNNKIALFTSLVYCTAPYRLSDIYVRSAVGEYSAMCFFPLILTAVYLIYKQENNDRKSLTRNAILLALGMTGVIESHILSTEMVIVFLFLLCIVMLKKTIKIYTIATYLFSAFIVFLLCLSFIVPFLDYYINVPVKINDTVSGDIPKKIQSGGVYIAQLFDFFSTPFGKHSDCVNERMQLTPGMLLMITFVVTIILLIYKSISKDIKITFAFSCVALFIASDIFPWNYIAANFKAGNYMAQVQFPWRYLGIACIIMTFLFGLLLQKFNTMYEIKITQKIYMAFSLVSLVSVFLFNSHYMDGANIINYKDTSDLNTNIVLGGEYLRSGTNLDEVKKLTNGLTGENVEVQEVSSEGLNMVLYCKTGDSEGKVSVPRFNYKGYRVMDKNGTTYTIYDGKNNVITFDIPANYDGELIIDYIVPWYWRVAEAISLIAWVCLIFQIICTRDNFV